MTIDEQDEIQEDTTSLEEKIEDLSENDEDDFLQDKVFKFNA